MARIRTIQNSLNAGEWSPLLAGRTDLAKYKNSVATMENMIAFKHGGAYRRPGTRFVAEVKTSSKKTRLIDFQFSQSQNYIIEMGDGYMRFYKNGARIESPPGTPVEIVSPYLEADLFAVTYAQSADVLYMACQGYAPQKLTRTSDTVWGIAAVAFTSSPWGAGPYPACVTLYQQRSWWANTTSAPDTIWGSQTGDYENLDKGTALDNEGIEFTLSSNKLNAIVWLSGQRALLVGTVGQEHVLSGGSIDDPITPSNPNSQSPTKYGSTGVAPAIAGSSILFLQRAGRKLRELLMDSYAVAYTGPFQDVTVLSEHVTLGGITQMAYQQELDSIIWAVRADGTLVGITYEKTQDVVAAHRHVTDGLFQSVASIPHPDQDQDQVWVIVKRTINGSQKRYVEYFDTKGGYYGNLGVDCGLTYPTSSKNIVSSSAAFLFDITGNSRLTYYCPAHGLAPAGSVSISSVLLDGGVGVNPFNGTFSVESVLDADHFTVLYGGNVDGESGTGGSFPVSVSATATLTGLSHLEAKSVDIVGNGAVYPQKTVASGQVTGLNPTVTVAEVGLHFDSTIETMRPDAGQDAGTAQGEQKSINDITVRLYKSLGCTIQGDLLTFRKPADPMGLPPPMFTGDKRVTNLGWSTEGQITIQQTQPLPMTVLAIITEISVGG